MQNGTGKKDPAEEARIRRAMKKKNLKKKKQLAGKAPAAPSRFSGSSTRDDSDPEIEVEYVAQQSSSRDWQEYQDIFDKFTTEKVEEVEVASEPKKPRVKMSLDKESSSESDDEAPGKSKRQKRIAARVPIASLKGVVKRPEVVDIWDTHARDPQLLVYLKAYRNTVAIPRHWLSKRKYMANKRGLEKPPFRLPDYIETTGIAKIRRNIQERDAERSLRSKGREKAHPRMGKLDIDYQVLHDAFFKYQTAPHMTRFNEMYYEGKEFEAKMQSKTPGVLSESLRAALGMTDNMPPPWLVNMQRYGPPPAYPRLRIPGLNAPIPSGCEYGYHPGGWGKPPVDEHGTPLYGTWVDEDEEKVEAEFWGEPEDNEDESDMDDDDATADGQATPAMGTPVPGGLDTPVVSLIDGMQSVSGLSSVTSGLDTPDSSSHRRSGSASVSGISSATMTPTPQLFQILEEQKARPQRGALFPSQRGYKASYGGISTPTGISTPFAGIQTPGGIATPIGGIATPIGGIATPIGGIATPIGGIATPIGGIGTPIGGIGTPIGGIATPIGGIGTPIMGMRTPVSGYGTPGIATPIGGKLTPHGGVATPIGGIHTPGISTPMGGIGTPISGFQTPGSATPVGGASSSRGGIQTPLGGSRTPGISTPIGGIATPTGIQTPMGLGGIQTPTGISTPTGLIAHTPVGGIDTPGMTVTLNPSSMEQEGILTADIIRKQLKQHESALAKAKKDAGISEKKAEKRATEKKDKKSKKKFKF